MASAQTDLLVRLRDLLSGEATLREQAMFGTRALMVNDKIVACARRDGSLLVRVAPAQHDELVDKSGAEQAEMGEGRTMGAGWLTVAADAIADDAVMGEWVRLALEFNRASN